MIRAYSSWKSKISISKLEYLHLSFNKWPSIQYKLWVSLVLWNHNNGEDCWLGNDPEDEHRGSLLKGVAVYRVLYQSILNAKLTRRKNLGRKRCTSNRDDRKLENTVQAKLIQTLGRASQGVDWSWSQCIKSHHAQTSSGKGLPSHFWTRDNVRSILPGLWRKRTGLLLSGPKSSFQMKVNLAFHLEIKVWSLEEEWRGTESMLLEVQCEVSTVSDDLGCHVICWCWSTVFSEVHSQRSHLPGNFRALHASFCRGQDGDADFIFQQDLAPTHTAKCTKSWFNDHGVTVLDWPANSPDLNPIENLWGIVKRKMRDTRPTMQMTWRPLSKKPGLPYHLSSDTNWSPPCHAELRQ